MLTVLQKEYTLDLIDFAKWQDRITFRKTFMGKTQYYFGKICAAIFAVRLGGSIK
jgi:hypothetical protein